VHTFAMLVPDCSVFIQTQPCAYGFCWQNSSNSARPGAINPAPSEAQSDRRFPTAPRGYRLKVLLEFSIGIPIKISTGTGLPSRIAGLNFHCPNAARAAASISGTTP
jgi:hypothetical protein